MAEKTVLRSTHMNDDLHSVPADDQGTTLFRQAIQFSEGLGKDFYPRQSKRS